MLSAIVFRSCCEHAAARGCASVYITAHGLHVAVYLTADDVIAATRDTMEATLDYLDQKYGSIDKYCQEVRSPATLLPTLCEEVCAGMWSEAACVSRVLRPVAAHQDWCCCVKLLILGGSWQVMTAAGSPRCCFTRTACPCPGPALLT